MHFICISNDCSSSQLSISSSFVALLLLHFAVRILICSHFGHGLTFVGSDPTLNEIFCQVLDYEMIGSWSCSDRSGDHWSVRKLTEIKRILSSSGPHGKRAESHRGKQLRKCWSVTPRWNACLPSQPINFDRFTLRHGPLHDSGGMKKKFAVV